MPESTGDKHACLSPSSAHLWLNCPYYAYMKIQETGGTAYVSKEDDEGEDVSSDAAKEGTYAHALAETVLKRYLSGGDSTVSATDGKDIKENPPKPEEDEVEIPF